MGLFRLDLRPLASVGDLIPLKRQRHPVKIARTVLGACGDELPEPARTNVVRHLSSQAAPAEP
ncbi:hypothetical protein [Streptomyces sp. NPDC054804]